MKKALTQLRNIFDGELYFDDLYKMLYATDASVYRKLPLAVAFPRSEKAIKQLILFAEKHKTSLIPRTAGTSLAGQCVGDGIVVDVSKYFTKIISVNKIKKTVTVQPGVIRDELNEYLKPFGLFFGPNTSTSNRCMIGGMVGNNSSGTTSIQYGVTRDKVIALRTLLSNGESVTFKANSKKEFLSKAKGNTLEGNIYNTLYTELISEETQQEIRYQFPKKEIHRRNTGYAVDTLINTSTFSTSDKDINLCTLLSGSEGTLALTTEITLELDDLPPPYTTMVVTHYNNIEACLNDVIVAMKHNLYTCEMMDDVILECTKVNLKYNSYRFFINGNPKVLLLLELRSNSASDLEQQTRELLGSLEESGLSYSAPVLKGKDIDKALELRKAGLGLLGNMIGDKKAVACIEDTAVTLDDLPSFISDFTTLMKEFNQKAVYYAHAGAGELHLRPILNLKDEEGVHHFREITTKVALLAKKYKGSFSGEHGDGIVRSEFLPMLIGETNYSLLKRIKSAFDPSNIFNPGKIVNAFKMDESLRYDSNIPTPEINTFMDFSDSEGILRLAEKCNGSGDCRKTSNAEGTMCPSYRATKNEKDSTRARANALREVLTNNQAVNKFNSKELKEVFDLCLSCKACATECPSSVDIAVAKSEFLYQYNKANGVSFTDKIFARSSIYSKRASKFPGISNAFFKNRISSRIIKILSGFTSKRNLPLLSSKSFSNLNYTTVLQEGNFIKEVYLFVDEFSNYFDANISWDSFKLLTDLRYRVNIIDHLDSARAYISKGFLKEAKFHANRNIEFLKEKVSENKPLLGIEPSAILTFRDEYLRLADDKASAKVISKNTYLIEEFISSEMELGNIVTSQFTSEEKIIKIHNHCHQKALSNQKVTFNILNLPVNYKPVIIPSGCCGMAGSFGFEKEHYDLSIQIGEQKLFPVIRKSDNSMIIAANGASCRLQIKDGTNREAQHPVTILRNALK